MELLIVIGVLCIALAATLNATATADIVMKEETGDYGSTPAVDADIIYEGSMVGDNAAGYGRPLVAGDKFLGHCSEYCDNSAGAAGAKNIRHKTGRYRLQVTLASVAITDVHNNVYASDDTVYTQVKGANTLVGRIVRHVAANTCLVEFDTSVSAAAVELMYVNTAFSDELVDTAGVFTDFSLTKTINGADLKVGDVLNIRGCVLFEDFNAADTLDLKVMLGTEAILQTGDVTPAADEDTITFDLWVTVKTIGATGKIYVHGNWETDLNGTVVNYIKAPTYANAAGLEEDISGDVIIKCSGDWSALHADNECVLTDLKVIKFG